MMILILLGIYVVLIFSFATIYWLLRRDFHHPYARFEAPVKAELPAIAKSIAEGFERQASEHFPKGNYEIVPGKFAALDFKANELGFEFTLYFVLRDDNTVGLPVILPVKISIDQTPMRVKILRSLGQEFPFKNRGTLKCDVEQSESLKFLAAYVRNHLDPKPHPLSVLNELNFAFRFIFIDPEPYARMVAYHSAFIGFPPDAPGAFWRLLYFSVVTITTVGYGDIVPLTGRARFVAGFQTTLGYIALGLLGAAFYDLIKARNWLGH